MTTPIDLEGLKAAASCCRVAAEAFEAAITPGNDVEGLIIQGLDNLRAGQGMAAKIMQARRRAHRRMK